MSSGPSRPRPLPAAARILVGVAVLAMAACVGQTRPGATTAPTPGAAGAGQPASSAPTVGFGPSMQEVAMDVGVTPLPCPDAVNPDNGCIKLGVLSDLSGGPASAGAVTATVAQQAFWQRVNEQGGIADTWDVWLVEAAIHPGRGTPDPHRAWEALEGDVVAMAQVWGTAPLRAINQDLAARDVVAVPLSHTSDLDTVDNAHLLESGASHCVEAMNAVDHAARTGQVASVLAVHVPGAHSRDGAAGAKLAASRLEATFSHVRIGPNSSGRDLAPAVDAVLQADPDVLVLSVLPSQVPELLSAVVARGWSGQAYGTSMTWDSSMLDSVAADAIIERFTVAGSLADFDADTAGHTVMRWSLGGVAGHEGFTAGWVASYPLLAALEQAHHNGDLTRAGLRAAVDQLDAVDTEGMLPPGATSYTGDANDQAWRGTVLLTPDRARASGLRGQAKPEVGATARSYDFTRACHVGVDLPTEES